jgi:hypothetical protein
VIVGQGPPDGPPGLSVTFPLGRRAAEDDRQEARKPFFQVIAAQAHAAMTTVPDGDGLTTPAEHRRTLAALSAFPASMHGTTH